jgi:hypothetical protein
MAQMKTLSGRVPAETEERFEEFRIRRGMNKTDAMRHLIEEGLDSYDDAEKENDENSDAALDSDEVKIGPLTQSEKWFRQKFESSLSTVFLSAAVTLALFLAYLLAYYLAPVVFSLSGSAQDLMVQVFAVLITVGLSIFLVSILASILTYAFLKLGIARFLDRRRGEAGQESVQ